MTVMRHIYLALTCSLRLYKSLQMVLYDTPGVIEKKMHKLDSMMMKNNVRSAAVNADCVVVVVDACKMPEKLDEVLEGVGDLKDKLPTLLVLNKKDLIKPGEIAKKLQYYQGIGPNYSQEKIDELRELWVTYVGDQHEVQMMNEL
ncbi:GTPase ERA-like, chloroplastic isoform X1 [Beta vulgaris subsp. vulgaris]|uniref:GTPase ERA-like, chloroplastic isoform X1 n=2 Tax=Beta vulgaris subsp. vulgaris TaxID=3555 RepID=UPI00053F726C|nr:GTPase ERA-like, chloroplastic isoform X1 [Beta vulgaris subsp. vulgaris]